MDIDISFLNSQVYLASTHMHDGHITVATYLHVGHSHIAINYVYIARWLTSLSTVYVYVAIYRTCTAVNIYTKQFNKIDNI